MKSIKKWIRDQKKHRKNVNSLIMLALISTMLDKIGIQMINADGQMKSYHDISFEVRDKCRHCDNRMTRMLEDAIRLCQ